MTVYWGLSILWESWLQFTLKKYTNKQVIDNVRQSHSLGKVYSVLVPETHIFESHILFGPAVEPW